jgi:predicted amidohydrolase YtcJ
MVLINGNIVTVDDSETVAEAIAVKWGRIIAIGSSENIEEFINEETKVFDLKGRIAIPGFIDSHSHMASVGAQRMIFVDLSEEEGIKSITDLVNKLRERAKMTAPGEWVFGYQEDDSKLAEKRHPTRWDLDMATTNHPLIISTVGGHFSIANSKAFEIAKITKNDSDPVGGKFDRDPDSGELTGGLHEKAIDLVKPSGIDNPTEEQSYEGAKQILKECAAVGLTCIYDMVEKPQIKAYIDLKNKNELPIRVRMDAGIQLFNDLNNTGIIQGIGDDWLKLCGLKFFFDGAISARTAAVTEEYLNKPGFYGVMATTREIAVNTIMDAYAAGYRISAHANGDRAIEMYLDIMEEVQAKYPRSDPRNRDIHCTVVTKQIVNRIKRLGILPTIFGPYPYYHGDKLIPAFGQARLERMFAARWLLDADIKLAAHSDHPCAPYPPLMALHALVNRKTKSGKSLGSSQSISVMEALRLYTINSAYQSFDEEKMGSIEIGKLADIVVLGKNLLKVSPEEIKDIPIDMTIIDGKVIYRRSGT